MAEALNTLKHLCKTRLHVCKSLLQNTFANIINGGETRLHVCLNQLLVGLGWFTDSLNQWLIALGRFTDSRRTVTH